MRSLVARKINALLIDEDEENIKSITQELSGLVDCSVATNLATAANLLTNKEIEVIIVNQQLSNTTGVEVLTVLKQGFPKQERILFATQIDAQTLTNAINNAGIFQYISMPADMEAFAKIVELAYENYLHKDVADKHLKELQRANDELNRFVYSTSHDLRGPMASVLAILNLIKVDKSVTDPNNYMHLIEGCMRKMDVYVQKIIEYYKSVRIKEEPEIIDFKVLVEDCISHVKFQNTGITFHVFVDQKTIFKGDVFRLSVIFNNLISNAMKYQRNEELDQFVKVTVLVNEEYADITVQDNGIGIIEEHINSIFQMFFRGQYAVSGIGIGLYIVKEALTKIGGDIQVMSTHGEGSSFILKIPNRAFNDAGMK